MSSCCSPGRGAKPTANPPLADPPTAPIRNAAPGSSAGLTERVDLPGGTFLMGTEDRDGFPGDGEGPIRAVTLAPFGIGATAVTNAQFTAFVDDTGYRTETQAWGWSFVFAAFLPAALRKSAPRPPQAPWWCAVNGANWRSPEGPGSTIEDRADHPVVQVSWADASAYCDWAGGRLPSEAEWEYAARGGLEQARFAWGDELTPGGEHRCNIWQGTFPAKNSQEDGYLGTAPVRSFPPNGFGLYEVAGNVWEWTADWWNPSDGGARAMRGGSYLCHASYCNRYRVAARTSNDADSAGGNLGFRCAYDR